MDNTVKIQDKKQVKMIAHRGVSGLEAENTLAAFIAAGNRSHYGIETDVRRTADGKYVVIHDEHTGRVGEKQVDIETSDFDAIRAVSLLDKEGKAGRVDLHIPSLEEYILTCKRYNKIAILELKSDFEREEVLEICDIIQKLDYFEQTVFISFSQSDLLYMREKYPNQRAQLLVGDMDEQIWNFMVENHFGLDIYCNSLTKDLVEKCHKEGLEVNCFTVDDTETAEKMISYGVDYITSNILE